MVNANELYDFINTFAPFMTQEEWDNSGILINSGESADKVLVSLDITADTVAQAKVLGCKIIISHHPVIFKPIKSISSDSVVYMLIENKISAVCAHTNVDKAERGICAVLAQHLELLNTRMMMPLGCIGELSHEMSTSELAAFCATRLGTCVQASNSNARIKTVAVIGGSGADYIKEAKKANADCLVTGEAGHHDALDASAIGLALIVAGHFETENIIVPQLCDMLQAQFTNTKFYQASAKSPFVAINYKE